MCTWSKRSRSDLIERGPVDPFNHAVSFVVNCEDQAEIDRYWKRASPWRLGAAVRLAEAASASHGRSFPPFSRDDDRPRSSQGQASGGRCDDDGKPDIAALQAAYTGTSR
jgi:hypothetical protein